MRFAIKEENDRILEELKALPEGGQIERLAQLVNELEKALLLSEQEIFAIKDRQKDLNKTLDTTKDCIKTLLRNVELQSGFSKMPTEFGTYSLMEVAENYQVTDISAVPADYIVTKVVDAVDKKKLNEAIKSGLIDTNVNWLEKRPAYKTLALK